MENKKPPVKISYSKANMYQDCPAKYKFAYIDRLEANVTHSALLFGSAIDQAVNFILESVKDSKPYDMAVVKEIFLQQMHLWDRTTELSYFSADAHGVDESDKDVHGDEWSQVLQARVWQAMVDRGLRIIDTFVQDALPKLGEIVHVQKKHLIYNDDADEFTFVLDFITKLPDGRLALIDLKTSSQPYPKDAVKKSVQLSLYKAFYPEVDICGYLVFQKKPDRHGNVKWQFILDEIPDEQIDLAFEFLETQAANIKSGEFPKNTKNCFKFGKKCDFYDLCHNGDSSNLKKKPERK